MTPAARDLNKYTSSCTDNFLEPLEDRIAPAVILAGGSGGIDYDSTPPTTHFYSTDSANPNPTADANISTLFDDSDDHYVITLNKGDTLKIWNSAPGAGYENFIQVSNGSIVAYFHDVNINGEVEANELTGLSLGNKANVSVIGSVYGDIVSNYNSVTQTISIDTLANQTISGVYVAGTVSGSILAGGAIANINVVGNVEQILTGTETGGYTYDFGGIGGDGSALLTAFTPALKQAGASISNVKVGSTDAIRASDGGISGAGGSLVNLTIGQDFDGFTLAAGAGGNGNSTSLNGGAGGKISLVYVSGVPDANDSQLIRIEAGDGGSGYTANPVFGKGGAGGSLDKVYVGYQLTTAKKQVRSDVLLEDQVHLFSGTGGDGKIAGAGGAIVNVKIASSSINETGDDLIVQSGDGGSSLAYGVAKSASGAGGNISTLEIRNFNATETTATVRVESGAGGDANAVFSAGGRAGSLSGITALGFNLSVIAGAGADGATSGGAGGSVNSLVVEALGSIVAQQVVVTGGQGGNGGTGVAGAGGSVAKLNFTTVDITGFAPSTKSMISGGDGGNSVSSRGGNGGSISVVTLNDQDTAAEGLVEFIAGSGGNGPLAGGAGGSLIGTIALVGTNLNAVFQAGNGGNGLPGVKPAVGGNGGNLVSIGALVSGFVGVDPNPPFDPLPASISASAGDGGASSGKAKAGAGGYVLNSNFAADASLTLNAGNGGAAELNGTSGVGGYLKKSSAVSLVGSVTVQAGNGGTVVNSLAGGAGGSIDTFSVRAFDDVSITAGNGVLSGAGGSLLRVTFGGADFGTSSIGDVLITAGNGGTTLVGVGGKGGAITTLTGYASSDDLAETMIKAGDGGDGFKGGNVGGTISGLTIYDGATDGQLTIWAGEGGNSTSTGKGGAGGNVTGVNIAANILLSNLIAGDGGTSSVAAGGVGGSISKVYSQGDIGQRSGSEFGFDAANRYDYMGGIFAGQGGSGLVKGLPATAKSGSVALITADAISSIIAGKGFDFALTQANLVTSVNQIYLNGLQPPTESGGAYTDWDTANFVGSIAGDPTVAGADIYQTTSGDYVAPWLLGTTKPLDGLIAALTLGVKRNFQPTAFLSVDKLGDEQFAGSRVN